MKKRGITRRTLVTGAAALASYQALADGLSGSMSPQLGGTIDIDGFDGGLGIARAWSPTQLAPGTNAAWWDASNTASVGVISGQVAQLTDLSGNGNNLVQANAAKQPTYNGQILFSGGGDYLQTASNFTVSGSTQRTIFAAAKNFTSFPTVVFWGAQSAGNGFGLDFKLATAATGYVWGQNDLNFGTPFTGNLGLLVFGNDNVNSYGGANGQLSLTTVADAINTTAAVLSMGARPSGTTNFSMVQIAEVLIVTGAMPTALRQTIEGYLAWKWSFQASLPAGHPYKNRRP